MDVPDLVGSGWGARAKTKAHSGRRAIPPRRKKDSPAQPVEPEAKNEPIVEPSALVVPASPPSTRKAEAATEKRDAQAILGISESVGVGSVARHSVPKRRKVPPRKVVAPAPPSAEVSIAS